MTWTRDRHKAEQGPLLRRLRNLIRRVAVHATLGGVWQVEGYDGEKLSDVEVFSGVGFASRPGADSKAEVIVAHVGGAPGHPVIIATRDRSIEVELDEGELALFNGSGAKVRLTKEGDIEVWPKYGRRVHVTDGSGEPQPLVTRSEFLRHGHPTAATGPVSGPVASPAVSTQPTRFPGTVVLRAT